MKPNKNAMLLLSVLLLAACTGCSRSGNPNPKEVITSELGQLKDMDAKAVEKYISYQDVFPQAESSGKIPKEIDEVISLFFKDFDYDISNLDTQKDQATATVSLTTIDAQQLAKDFTTAELKEGIQAQLDTKESEDLSLAKHYELLYQVLKDGSYNTVQSDCTIQLVKQEDQWAIVRDEALENALVGGFITYMSNSNILTPGETVSTYFDTLKGMDATSMGQYIGLTDLLSSSNSNSAITNALMEQVHNHFSYTIKTEESNDYQATVVCDITSFDSSSIQTAYTKQMEEYNQTVDAVIDGQEGREAKSNEILLSCIKEATGTITTEVTLQLTNNTHHWQLDFDDTFGKALFGNFGQSSDSTDSSDTDTESTTDSSDSSDSTYDEDSYDDSYSDSYDDSYDDSYSEE